MSLDERFEHEGMERSQAERDEAETDVSRVDELRQHLRDTALLVARELHELKLLDPRGLRGCDTADEVIEGAGDEADEIFAKLLWTERFKQTKKIADGEE